LDLVFGPNRLGFWTLNLGLEYIRVLLGYNSIYRVTIGLPQAQCKPWDFLGQGKSE